MASADCSLQTLALARAMGDSTTRKRKQSCGDQLSVSPARRGSRLRYQESGSSSSLVTTLADARQEAAIFRRLYQTENSTAACVSAGVRSEAGRAPELQSVPSADTGEDVGGQGRKQGEGTFFDPFRPFSTRSPPKRLPAAVDLGQGSTQTGETAVLDRQSCESRGYNRNITPWEKGDWGSKADVGVGSESVGGRSAGTGASGVTKQGNSTSGFGSGSGVFRQTLLRASDNGNSEGEGKRRLSQEWNSASGSLSGVTKDRGVWESTEEEERDDGDAQSGGGAEVPSPSTPAGDAAQVSLPTASSIPVPDIAPVPAVSLQGKRLRREREEEEEEERVLKNVRLEAPKAVSMPNDVAAGPCHVLSRREPSALTASRDALTGVQSGGVTCSTAVPAEDGTPAAAAAAAPAADSPRSGAVVKNAATAQTPVADKTWEMRDGNGVFFMMSRERMSDSHTMSKERTSDSHTDVLEMESSGRLSGLDPDTSLSDAPDGDGNLFVLSSGRTRRRQGASNASRQPTIDDEFEQYFSQMLL